MNLDWFKTTSQKGGDKMSNFELVERPCGNCWKHKTKNLWIVFYEHEQKKHKPCYFVYKAIENKKGFDFWGNNNKRVASYYSLSEAMKYINEQNEVTV